MKYLKISLCVIVIFYISVCLLLYCYQDDLLFHPQHKSVAEINEHIKDHPNATISYYTMSDGTVVSGLELLDTSKEKKPLIIYFGGNAEEVSHMVNYKTYFKGYNLAFINYRGFGLSTGKPSEKTLFSDAIEVFDKIKKIENVDTNYIYIIGRSIGTGVATYLSSKRHVKFTVLITPYESMIKVAQEKYPIFPIKLLIKHPFNSEEYAKTIATPMLAIIAKNDEVIPPHHAHALLKKWEGTSWFYEFNDDHNSIMVDEEVWQKIMEFISK